MRGISASSMGCRALGTLRPYCFTDAVRYCVRCREQHWICGPGVTGRDGARPVTEQRRDCQVAISEVGAYAGEAVAQGVRRDIAGEARERGDASPKSSQLGHWSAAAR